MWIRHKISGRLFPLARHGGQEWSVGMSLGDNGDILKELDDFFSDHIVEDQHNGSNYEIVTEDDDIDFQQSP